MKNKTLKEEIQLMKKLSDQGVKASVNKESESFCQGESYAYGVVLKLLEEIIG